MLIKIFTDTPSCGCGKPKTRPKPHKPGQPTK